MSAHKHGQILRAALLMAGGLLAGAMMLPAADKVPTKIASTRDELSLGREMFLREWLPNDSRSHGGDGLGPVFNDSSCIACHNLGGVGGGGPANKNVDIVSAFHSPVQQETDSFDEPIARRQSSARLTDLVGDVRAGRRTGLQQAKVDAAAAEVRKAEHKLDLEKLAMLHPGFQSSRSVVLHRFGTKTDYDEWKADLLKGNVEQSQAVARLDESGDAAQAVAAPQSRINSLDRSRRKRTKTLTPAEKARQAARVQVGGMGRFGGGSVQAGNFGLVTSHRNTTSLFGVGLIDSIPDKTIEAAAAVKYADFPGVHGRVARLADGKIGRFGWKAQKATLREFAMTACAVELGLNVPEQQQAGLAYDPDYKAPGFDMDLKECDALVTFLKKLPAPAELKPVTDTETKYLHGGRDLFSKVGCAACHTPQLGAVAGIYSDLLVHDLGPELGDTGSYGVFVPGSATDDITEAIPAELTVGLDPAEENAVGATSKLQLEPSKKKVVGTNRQEWRTPPLWGIRDSAPYLHDGRAETLEQAIALHAGEADASAKRFFELSREQRMQLVAFLKSLVAPEQIATSR